jgi:hypothetical protein
MRENVKNIKYLGMTATNQNLIQEEIKSRSNSGNVCYHSIQSLSTSRLSINARIAISITIILIVLGYGCETLSPILREEHRLRVFEKRVLRKIFEPWRDDVTGDWGNLHHEELH